MVEVAELFWRAFTAADFFNIERGRAAGPTGGYGQLYISISFRGLTQLQLGAFLGRATPTEIETVRPAVTIEADVAYDRSIEAPLTFRSRYRPPQPDDRYYIANQNRQT